MAKRYRGNNSLGRVEPEKAPQHAVMLRVEPADIHLFTALMQGYLHLAFPVYVNPKEGFIIVHTTPDLFPEVVEIIKNLPCRLEIISAGTAEQAPPPSAF